ncbi:PqqD family protein [Chitinophaga rhizosphaerae]|uniref:PqqD family protein n=1 Tax=Chitinophaga rhizosphaerae TaxID=1864947 RepID=UPI000F800606|nr:PqqD family protein [Chitinophaga rhizosphaerae]
MSQFEKNINISKNTISREMGDAFVILNVHSERFYELNDVGKRFWELISSHHQFDEALSILQNEYDVYPDQLREDLWRLVEQLENAELIYCS